MEHLVDYLALFFAAFVSATLLPAQSEILLAGMTISGKYSVWVLLTVASIGNIAGSICNWFLGRFLVHFEERRWFPVRRERLQKAEGWYRRYGRWSLLLSWVPIIGDPLTIVAGLLRENLAVFVVLVAIAKTARYLIVVAATLFA